jgi:hypothetical protein
LPDKNDAGLAHSTSTPSDDIATERELAMVAKHNRISTNIVKLACAIGVTATGAKFRTGRKRHFQSQSSIEEFASS